MGSCSTGVGGEGESIRSNLLTTDQCDFSTRGRMENARNKTGCFSRSCREGRRFYRFRSILNLDIPYFRILLQRTGDRERPFNHEHERGAT